jgi:hypothetical protein
MHGRTLQGACLRTVFLRAKARLARVRDQSRSTISCLILPIAFAGLRPFGHVLVQFMIVWQR